MNIHEDGELDLAKATAELQGVGMIHDANTRRNAIATLQTAALLDIAGSLRIVAADAMLGLQGADDSVAVSDDDEIPMTDETRDFFVEGDRVSIHPADAADDGSLEGVVKKLGMSEDTEYAIVEWSDGQESRVWTALLFRILEAPATDEREHEGNTFVPTFDGNVTPDDEPEDDFEEAPSALEILEKKQKAAKKKGKK